MKKAQAPKGRVRTVHLITAINNIAVVRACCGQLNPDTFTLKVELVTCKKCRAYGDRK